MIQLFVTGTDTGVGKTTVACALLAAARARGLRAMAIKPVETGCARDPDGPLRPADALALERASRDPLARRETAAPDRPTEPTPISTVYRFAAPLAPSVAARMAGDAVALAPIVRAVDRLRSLAPDLLLIEGAGGLLVPLSESTDMTDLAAALAVPLLVVARDSLGTINHTLLTLEAAAARGLRVAGVVLCAAAPGTSDRDAARNADEIARRSRVPVLGRLGPLPDLEPSTLAEAAEAACLLDRLHPEMI